MELIAFVRVTRVCTAEAERLTGRPPGNELDSAAFAKLVERQPLVSFHDISRLPEIRLQITVVP